MEKEFCYVYSSGLLGVRTNIQGFAWIYGSVAPVSSRDEYEKCIVKFEIREVCEKDLPQAGLNSQFFQSYAWDDDKKSISCMRTALGRVKLGYHIAIQENTVVAQIGRNYYRYIKHRVMNLHGIYYLLSDLANILLLKNGYLSLYASAVHNQETDRCLVCFAAPNTGKTYTATRMCESPENKIVGEDVVITDGQRLYACPWTSSYRKHGTLLDSAGSFGRIKRHDQSAEHYACKITDLTVLSLGAQRIAGELPVILRKICMLNGYLFNYYSSPIVKMLSFFTEEYNVNWNEQAEIMLKALAEKCDCHDIQAQKTTDFPQLIQFR